MSWDFTTEPEFQAKLDWADAFVREEVEPLDLVWPGDNYKPLDESTGGSSTRSSSGCARKACGPVTSDPTSAAPATGS